MNPFNVLDRNLNIHQHYLLEASAGTGKTFSIENIATRLLIENTSPACGLDQILVMTFTRAAARDLKNRIRGTLEKALAILRMHASIGSPDYLQAILEKGPENVEFAKRRLEQAIGTFDKAQIFTIHGFCARMLAQFGFESDFHLSGGDAEERTVKREEIHRIIRDFFRTQLRPEIYSPTQLNIILKKDSYQIEKVQETVAKLLETDCDIQSTPDFSANLKTFAGLMDQLKNQHHLEAEKLREDVDRQSSFFKVVKNKEAIQAFIDLFKKNSWSAEDFDNLIKDGLVLHDFLDPENVKQNRKIPADFQLHYPHLFTLLNDTLFPLIEEARSYEFILARMAHHCRNVLLKYLSDEEKHRESDLLKKMLGALQNPLFAAKVRGLYQAAVIDEFQDTDPAQWEIFQHLFLNSAAGTKIYLVGDPKQSIYSFRQADIYTYLSAAQSLGFDCQASLNVNYRSQPSLVRCLNTLFQACPKMFSLPALDADKALDYPLVMPAPQAKDKLFSDALGSLHFFCANIKGKATNVPTDLAEEQYYFPFITQEILRLQSVDKLPFKSFAVLVKDKFQGQRIAQFFDRYNIPYSLQRQSSLTESIAWDSLKELLRGILNPRDESAVKIALGGPLLGWNYQEVHELHDPFLFEKILASFFNLKDILVKQGFACFFSQLIHSSWHADRKSVMERILMQERGDAFYDELNQIAHLLIEQQSAHPGSAENLIEFLLECQRVTIEDDERLKKFMDPTRNAVAILTIHNSKGLEYDIVFAYGLIGRLKNMKKMIPQKMGFTQCLIPCHDTSSDLYLKHCEEIDAEKMRQLYVAMTRAKHRLYVPVAVLAEKQPVELGCASPTDIFIARLGQPSCSYKELYQRIENEDGVRLCNFIQERPEAKITCTSLNEAIFSFHKISSEHHELLLPPQDVIIPGAPAFIQSFTSLTKNKNSILEPIQNPLPHDFLAMEKNPHTLPAGSLTGKLLHKLLELLPFSATQGITSADDLCPWIRPLIQNTPFAAWESVLCRMVFNALRTSLQDFCLAEINPSEIYRETEFLYPCEKVAHWDGMPWKAGFLKGVMDLIFLYKDRYYLIDWKSNWLGTDTEAYHPEKMRIAMQQHDYYFQAHIYKEALKRYLKLVDTRPFEKIYGGCFYVFLRGLDNSNPITGVLKV
jgi:exodeoxyribonuclease V beta subunit